MMVPVIVCYLLRVRLRRVTVSSVMFWEQVAEDHPERALHPRLRHLVSLLCQLLIVLILVLALADPRSGNAAEKSIILVVDNSASMGAVNDDESRFAQAVAYAKDVIDSLGPEQQAAIVSTSPHAVVHCRMTHHARTLRAALDGIQLTEASGRLENALRQAVQLATDSNAAIVLLTDDPPKDLPAGVTAVPTGASRNNVAITQFQVRQSLATPDIQHAFIEVRSFSAAQTDVKLEYRLNDQLVNVIPLSLEPGATWTHISDHPASAGGVLTVNLQYAADIDDALAADNVVRGVIPEPQRLPVTLVSPGGWFLGHAIEACDFVDLTVASKFPEQLPTDGLLVLDAITPAELPAGTILVVRPRTATELWDISAVVPEPLVGFQETGNRLLQHVHLENVLMPSASGITPKAEHQRLVDSISGSPLFVRFPREEGDVFVLTIDIDRSDLPLRTAFPILLNNLLSSVAHRASGGPAGVSTGQSTVELVESLQQAVNDGAMLQAIHQERGTEIPADGVIQEGRLRLSLPYSGLWEIRNSEIEDGVGQLVACNLTDAQESDLQRPDPQSKPEKSIQPASGQPWFLLLVVTVFVLMLVEWAAWHRRVIA